MSKIVQLQSMLRASGLTLPIEVRDETFLVDAEHEMICDTEAANPEELELIVAAVNALPSLLEAATMVRRARNLIAEAVNLHIYDEDNGDKPEPDCPYMAFLEESKVLLGKFK